MSVAHHDSVDARAHAPVRTCIGCRGRAPKHELLRVVAGSSDAGRAVVPDPQGRSPGRGAHLHPVQECLELAIRRRAFNRALRSEGGLDIDPVRGYLTREAQQD